MHLQYFALFVFATTPSVLFWPCCPCRGKWVFALKFDSRIIHSSSPALWKCHMACNPAHINLQQHFHCLSSVWCLSVPNVSVYGLNGLLTQKNWDFSSLIAILSKILFMSVFVCHRMSVCLCFHVSLCWRIVLMLLRQEVENLPPHLADEFCKSATFYEQGREGREKKRGEGMWLPAAVYGLRASREFCMTSPSEGAEYTEPFQQSSRTPLFIFV